MAPASEAAPRGGISRRNSAASPHSNRGSARVDAVGWAAAGPPDGQFDRREDRRRLWTEPPSGWPTTVGPQRRHRSSPVGPGQSRRTPTWTRLVVVVDTSVLFRPERHRRTLQGERGRGAVEAEGDDTRQQRLPLPSTAGRSNCSLGIVGNRHLFDAPSPLLLLLPCMRCTAPATGLQ